MIYKLQTDTYSYQLHNKLTLILDKPIESENGPELYGSKITQGNYIQWVKPKHIQEVDHNTSNDNT